MKTIYETVHDLNNMYFENKKEILETIETLVSTVKTLETELANLNYRVELLQNQVDSNEKTMTRHHWENITGINYDWKE